MENLITAYPAAELLYKKLLSIRTAGNKNRGKERLELMTPLLNAIVGSPRNWTEFQCAKCFKGLLKEYVEPDKLELLLASSGCIEKYAKLSSATKRRTAYEKDQKDPADAQDAKTLERSENTALKQMAVHMFEDARTNPNKLISIISGMLTLQELQALELDALVRSIDGAKYEIIADTYKLKRTEKIYSIGLHSDSLFVGRTAALNALYAAFTTGYFTQIIGSEQIKGKTFLALSYARLHAEEYQTKLLSNINRTGTFSAFAFLLLALTCLFPISKGEQSTEAVTGTAQSSSLTLSVTGDTASVELDVNSTEGTFASSSTDNSAAFSVTTNNFSGYTLSISGTDTDGKLYDDTKKFSLAPLTSAVSEADFSSTTSLNGKWGYKPSKFNSALNDNYLPAPTTEASTLDKTATANTTANNYTISLGLRADYTTTANTYSNSFIITAVPNPIAYVITYDANTTDTVSNMPASQNSTTSATEITLSDKTPAREGYDFKGWCTIAPTTTNPDTCTGTTFQPGDTYGIDQTSENITVLYAIWKKQIIYIQDYSYAQCSTEAVDAPATVVDKRDNKEYIVRYINGLCTMTQNLDFALTSGMTLSPDTTNVTSSRTLSTVGSLTAGDSYDEPRTAKNSNITGAGLHYNYAAATAGTITGSSNSTEATQDICPKGWRLPTLAEQTSITGTSQDNFSTTNVTAFNAVAAGNYVGGSLNDSGSYGNWWSSTADSNASRYSLFYDTTLGLYSGNIYYRGSSVRNRGFSVRCVKAKPGVTISFNANGGTGTMDMQKIDAGQSANLTANTFTRTDYVFTGWNTEPDGPGTSYSNQANYTAPASEDNKIVVLYAQWAEISLQNYTKALCQAEASSAPAELADSRDGNSYRVKYINGLCTMIDNLRLAPGKTITSADSNVSSNYTIPSDTSFNSYTVGSAIVSSNTTYGGYYNYCAATAGTICQSPTMTEATYDICPKGWRLPAGRNTSTGYEQKLLTNNVFGSYQANGTFDDSFKVAAGRYYNGSLSGSGTAGYWWSSTANNGADRYLLYYNTSNGLLSGDYYYRYNGYSVRCVLK